MVRRLGAVNIDRWNSYPDKP